MSAKNITCCLFLGLLVLGCSTKPTPRSDSTKASTFASSTTDSAPIETILQPPSSTSTSSPPPQAQLLTYEEQKGVLSRRTQTPTRYKTKTLQLNFVDVEASEVAQTVIRDALGKTISIAEDVTGTITLTSAEPVPTKSALEALETVLATSGFALIEKPSGYLLTTLEAAKENGLTSLSGEIGLGVTMLPVKNTIPSNITRLITPLVSKTVTVTADDTQGLITLSGPQSDVSQVIQSIKMFDTPLLTDRVFGMFEVQYTEVSGLRSELESILGARSPNANNLTTFIELPRLNRLFVVSRNKDLFEQVQILINDLDVPSGGDERRLRYYVVKNTPAGVLAQQLGSAFGISASRGQTNTTRNTSTTDNRGASPSPTSTATSPNNLTSNRIGSRDTLSIVPDELNNALIIRATDSEYRELQTLIDRMDVLPPQVLIEATIAEVTLTNDLSFGIRWFFNSGQFSTSFSDDASGAVARAFPGVGLLYQDGLDSRVALDTLASVTDVTVLSAPSIMVQNNQSANLQVGDEVPILTQQSTGTTDPNAPIVSTVQLRETGVILDVKPRINASDMVVLEISQEVSEAVDTVTAGINSPTIRQRQFSSTVAVRNNGTIALGGLIRESATDNETSIPGLGRIPVMGNLFKTQNQSVRRTELIIFLTPRIVRNSTDAENVMTYLQQELDGLQSRLDNRP